MGRHKIDYGIDLGTTNSAIARMENGVAKVNKSDDLQMDTTPSCVYFNPKQTVFVGLRAYNQISNDAAKSFMDFSKTGNKSGQKNAFQEFKRAMGTDVKYPCANLGKDCTPEELSAEVLKKLRGYIREEDVSAAVITIPMMFEQFQVDATRKAAELAGFTYIETLQEPIAASIAYGMSTKKTKGYWLVFDFGGGTFDAALLRVNDGIMKVEDTAGDTRLGGKDIDYAIVDKILIPYLSRNYCIDAIMNNNFGKQLLRDSLKRFAEEAKIRLSKDASYNIGSDDPIGNDDNGEEMELDVKITIDDYKEATCFIYQRTIDIANELIQKHRIKDTDLESVVLVGGPTYSQTLRQMLRDKLSPNIEFGVDPMTVVAQGAALYASARDIPIKLQKRDKTKIQLKLTYPGTTVELEENLGIKIEQTKTTEEIPKTIFIEVIRGGKGWSSGKVEVQGNAEIIPLLLEAGKTNVFTINLYDEKGNQHICEPSQINIIQGLNAAKQIIPFHFCLGVAFKDKEYERLIGIKGLEKNQTLPAKGKSPVLKTQKDVRPGMSEDEIKIPIYGGEPDTKALYNNWVGTVVITGEDIDKFLPKDSEVEITLYVDSTQKIKVTAYFPYIDETVQKGLVSFSQKGFDPDEIEREMTNAENMVSVLINNPLSDDNDRKIEKLQRECAELASIFENGRGNDDEERKVKERLREVLKEIDKIREESEIPKAKQVLKETMERLNVVNHRYGNNQTTKIVDELEMKARLAMNEQKDIKLIEKITDTIEMFKFSILWEDPGFLVGYIKHYDDEFSSIKWTNPTLARKQINEAKKIIATQFSKKEIQNIILSLYDLLPEGTKPFKEQISTDILIY